MPPPRPTLTAVTVHPAATDNTLNGQGTGLTAAERRAAKALNSLIADTDFASVQAPTARELRALRRDELKSGGKSCGEGAASKRLTGREEARQTNEKESKSKNKQKQETKTKEEK